MTPAEVIIEKFGGFKAVADICEIGEIQVRRWTYTKSCGGTDGFIPGRHQTTLLLAAQKLGVELSPSDFFNIQTDAAE